MRKIELRELVAIEVAVRPAVDLGNGRRVVTFSGGTFSGRDGLQGRVLEGGIDWQQSRPDGILEIDAHYVLVTDGDESIEVRSVGLRRAAPVVVERIMRGEDVDPDSYYFRTHVRLNAVVPRLAWLNNLLAVSTGQRDRDLVRIHVHEML
jgi:Protein of unknown function (DUF3237)